MLDGGPQWPGERMYASGIVADGDDGFALRRVPWYGWAALGLAGWGLYMRQINVVMAAVTSWLFIKLLRGRI